MNDEEKSKKGLFYKVIPLHEEPDLTWEEAVVLAPKLPKGWFELSRLSKEDRIDFTLQYWLAKLKPTVLENELKGFFENLEDIGFFLAQEHSHSPFEIFTLYSSKDEKAFFQGSAPARKEAILRLKKLFENTPLPEDYLGFLEIHDGFSKYLDRGLIKTSEMAKSYLTFQESVAGSFFEGEIAIHTSLLVPFYESHLLHSYQCFYSDKSEDGEIVNVSYMLDQPQRDNFTIENSFPSFFSWLIFYLQDETDV